MQIMNWDDLRILVATARFPTLSGAARELGVNQTTVSRRLQSLEADLGVRLFDRGPEGIAITPAGERVVGAAARIADAVADLGRQAAGEDARLGGSLRVTTLDIVAAYDADLFGGFADRYPGIALELSTGDMPRNLTRREADIAIRWTNAPPEHLVGRRVARAEFALYGAVALLDGTAPGAELPDYPWLDWDDSVEARLTRAWMRRHAPDARIVCRFDAAPALHAAVKAGIGLAFLPCGYADRDPGLRRLRPPEPGFGMDVWVLTHADLRNTARVRAFTDHAAAFYTARRAAFAGDAGNPPT